MLGMTYSAAPLMAYAASTPLLVALKDGPTDTRQVYALAICTVAGCIAQLSYLFAHIGDDTARPVLRWVGEVVLGGFAAYISCIGFLKYGPTVDLPQLIVPAILGGFIGQRLLSAAIDAKSCP